MTLLTTSQPTGEALSPEERSELIIGPLQREALALRTTRVLQTSRDAVQVPLLTEDVPTDWVAEGQELPTGEPDVREVTLRPAKLAALTSISSELAEDSEPGAAELIGQSIARSLRSKLDMSFVSAAGGGLPSAGVFTTATAGAALGASLDAVSDAITTVEAAGGTADVIVMSPSVWGRVRKLRTEDTANTPLLGVEGQPAGQRTLFGVTVFVDATVPDDTIGVWDSSAVAVALRRDVKVETDTSVYFSSDNVAVRATLRAAWAVLDPARVVTVDASAA